MLGAAGSVAADVDEAACEADGVPVLRRSSGGGTVVIGPGCLLFSLVLDYRLAQGLSEIVPSARYVLGRVLKALTPVAGGAVVEGISDLAVGGRKFSGNAQQRKRSFFLHHGTLLYGFDLGRISRYLKPPERQPGYRRDRPHDDFLMNLPADAASLRASLVREWGPLEPHGAVPWDRIRELVAEKFGRDEWVRRR